MGKAKRLRKEKMAAKKWRVHRRIIRNVCKKISKDVKEGEHIMHGPDFGVEGGSETVEATFNINNLRIAKDRMEQANRLPKIIIVSGGEEEWLKSKGINEGYVCYDS